MQSAFECMLTTVAELMAKEKVHPPQLCLDTIRTAIQCVPIAMTQALPPELLTLLCRYLVHLDKCTNLPMVNPDLIAH